MVVAAAPVALGMLTAALVVVFYRPALELVLVTRLQMILQLTHLVSLAAPQLLPLLVEDLLVLAVVAEGVLLLVRLVLLAVALTKAVVAAVLEVE